jgi:hypothetical protein
MEQIWIIMFLRIFFFNFNLYITMFRESSCDSGFGFVCCFLSVPVPPAWNSSPASMTKQFDAIACPVDTHHTWTAPKSSLNGDALHSIVPLLDPVCIGIQCEPEIKHTTTPPPPACTYIQQQQTWVLTSEQIKRRKDEMDEPWNAQREMKNAHKSTVGEHEETRPHELNSCRRENNIDVYTENRAWMCN